MQNKKTLLMAIFLLVFFAVPFFSVMADIYVPPLCNTDADCSPVTGKNIICRPSYDPYMNNSALKRCLPPEVGQGDDCSDPVFGEYLCASPLICFFDEGNTETSKCLPKRKAGESCNIADSYQCDGTMICANKICVEGKSQGEPCNEYSVPPVYCGKGLACDNSETKICITDEEWGDKYLNPIPNGSASSNNSSANTSTGAFNYTPMEKIPGFEKETVGNFYTYIQAVYKFGIWAVGIAALLMISIGGFMYITSAGNNSSMEKAKGVISDAVIGLVLALTAYLLLYIINPDLVKIKPLPVIPAKAPSTQAPVGGPPVSEPPSPEACSPVTTGDCSISNLQGGCFGANAEKMSKICNQESHGSPVFISETDKCKDGKYFSIGLFQINMITSAGPICNGSDIFTVNGSNSGTCLHETTNSKGVKYCDTRDCEVKDMAKYNDCLAKLQNGSTNITLACSLSGNGANLNPWLTSKNICGL